MKNLVKASAYLGNLGSLSKEELLRYINQHCYVDTTDYNDLIDKLDVQLRKLYKIQHALEELGLEWNNNLDASIKEQFVETYKDSLKEEHLDRIFTL
jgi:hypothetical protein